jgi:hypothetical protein
MTNQICRDKFDLKNDAHLADGLGGPGGGGDDVLGGAAASPPVLAAAGAT